MREITFERDKAKQYIQPDHKLVIVEEREMISAFPVIKSEKVLLKFRIAVIYSKKDFEECGRVFFEDGKELDAVVVIPEYIARGPVCIDMCINPDNKKSEYDLQIESEKKKFVGKNIAGKKTFLPYDV